MKKSFLILIVFAVIYQFTFAQEAKIEMPLLDKKMSDFSLSNQNGEQVVLSELIGKNVLLIFPRGMVSDDHWCQICHYQYAELAKLEQELKIKDKYNLEVLFVLPYSKDSVKAWVEMFPLQMEVIHGWKHPDTINISKKTLDWSEKVKQILPIDFSSEAGAIDISFPVLADEEQLVSKGFEIYDDKKKEAPQNKPAVYILNTKGELKFKYISQNTFDRPSVEYLFNIIEKIVE